MFKKILLTLILMSLAIMPIFGVGGTYTTNGYFYLPLYEASGSAEHTEYNTYMQTADTQIEANKDGLTLRYLKTEIDTQGEMETIWEVSLATDSELHTILTLGTASGLSLDGQELSLALSSTSTTGALNDTDWDIFNNKISATGANTAITSLQNTGLYIGRDADNKIDWGTDDHLKIKIAGVETDIVSVSTGTGDNDKLVTQGYVDDAGGSADLKPYMVIDTTGNQAITMTEATVNLDSESVSNAGYSLASDEITVNQNGTYLISYSIIYDITNTSGSTRASVDAFIQDDHSDSFVLTPGSRNRCYHREASGGSGLSCSCLRALDNGDKIRLRFNQLIYTTNIDTVAGGVSLTILKVE